MKSLILLISLLFIFLSSFANADKVVITETTPVVVEQRGDVYIPSSAVSSTQSDYVFEVNDAKRVCYKEVQPGLSKIDLGTMTVRAGEDQVTLYCYDYSPDYFEIP